MPPAVDEHSQAEALRLGVSAAFDTLMLSRRPLFIGGNGIHLAAANEALARLLAVTRFRSYCPIPPRTLSLRTTLNIGIFGTSGQRRANFAVQNCDCLVALGVGLCVKKTGFNYEGFAPHAKRVVIDIDEQQLATRSSNLTSLSMETLRTS